ncbi:MAG: nitroreductase family protein [Hadesarchaea archaeon]|nr:nitroreductase family protein [Hadesarchaea archaeon]
MKFEDLLELIKNQGTIRKLKSDPIPENYLNKIFRIARWSPSAANTQPWEFVVVRKQKTKEEIAQILIDSQEKAEKEDEVFPYSDKEKLKNRVTTPPILIGVCADTRFKRAFPEFGYREQNLDVSMGIVIQNMILAAKSLGLALSWGTINSFARPKLQELLNIPKELKLMEILQLGVPAEKSVPGDRRNVQDLIHEEELDDSRIRSDEEINRLISSRESPDLYSSNENKKGE